MTVIIRSNWGPIVCNIVNPKHWKSLVLGCLRWYAEDLSNFVRSSCMALTKSQRRCSIHPGSQRLVHLAPSLDTEQCDTNLAQMCTRRILANNFLTLTSERFVRLLFSICSQYQLQKHRAVLTQNEDPDDWGEVRRKEKRFAVDERKIRERAREREKYWKSASMSWGSSENFLRKLPPPMRPLTDSVILLCPGNPPKLQFSPELLPRSARLWRHHNVQYMPARCWSGDHTLRRQGRICWYVHELVSELYSVILNWRPK